MIKHKVFLIIFIVTILFCLSVVSFYGGIRYERSQPKQIVRPPVPIPQTPPNLDLTTVEFKETSKKLIDLVDKKNPQEALQTLQALMNESKPVLRSCHALIHNIGNRAYIRYNSISSALAFTDDLCGSGYIHGVIEQYFKGSPALSELNSICPSHDGRCFHGVGHGLMYYTKNDVLKSLEYCNKYQDSIAKINCSDGVFMENFNTLQKAHPSKYLKENDIFYPCKEQTELFKGSCYFYAPLYYLELHPNDYGGMLNTCESVETSYQTTCARGLGSRAIKQNIKESKFVEALCMKNKNLQHSCIEGMTSYFIVNDNSTAKAVELCNKLEEENKATCTDFVNNWPNILGVFTIKQ